ncbi:MAG: hypothetical protein IKQ29_00885 [Bacilli bacterium]|nr:hypothetical protein [Bacilli bacterium]
MINVKRLNPKYILANGRYWDYNNGEMFLMRPDEILAARKYFNDPNIAKGVVIKNNKKYKNPVVSNKYYSSKSKKASKLVVEKVDKEPVVEHKEGKTFRLMTEQLYNDGHNYMLRPKTTFKFKKLEIMGMNIFAVGASFKDVSVVGRKLSEADTPLVEEPISVVDGNDSIDEEIKENETSEEVINSSNNIDMDDTDEDIISIIVDEMKYYVDKYAKVFHLNSDIAFEKLKEVTDNFTSEEFNEEFACKDLYFCESKVFANSYEQLVIFFLRDLKIDPGKYGLSLEQLVGNEDYVTVGSFEDGSYIKLIGDYCNLFSEDPCLVYAIIETETGWNSDELKIKNNPANLRKDGNLIEFCTYEEGIIETILRVKSYRYNDANTVEEMAKLHCQVDLDNDPNGLHINWINQVNKIYERIFDQQVELFGKEYIPSEML